MDFRDKLDSLLADNFCNLLMVGLPLTIIGLMIGQVVVSFIGMSLFLFLPALAGCTIALIDKMNEGSR